LERTYAELAELNERYEQRFGFRFVVFVNRRPKAEIVQVLKRRLEQPREIELRTGLAEMLAIARDRLRSMLTSDG
jgi:2-oxo-4-hydroxy-4-carboxy--5-ureidoimidazoline (OHCU) decarboxylase